MTAPQAHTPRPDEAPGPAVRCRHCGETGRFRGVGPRLQRCRACEFVVPLPRRRRDLGAIPKLDVLPALAPGYVLRDRYRLVELIGEGAHGLTCFAEHEFLNHPCVVKILPHRVSDASDAAARRLRHEAHVGFRVNDPNVVRVLDCDVIEGVWYFAMEYVDGVDLGAVLRAGVRIGWQQALDLALDATRGLAAIHRAGLIHRDIKPGNLLLGTDGRLRVTDLGVAALAGSETAPNGTAAPAAVGTLDYAAPELFEPDAAVDVRADLYALGATLYHVITGQPPHAGESVFQMLIDVQSRSVRWPPEAPAGVPDWFVSIILRLLASEPQERLGSAEALAESLQHPQAPPTAPVSVAAPTPMLQPRGLAVVPFENEARAGGDDWLGFALADALTRELSQVPGVYVAAHEQFESVHDHLEDAQHPSAADRLLAAGRLVGAGTVITGRFQRTGVEISFSAEIHRFGQEESVAVGPFNGTLSRLVELQAGLNEQVAGVLGLSRAAPRPGEPTRAEEIALETREKFTRGKQAYLAGDYEAAIELAREAGAESPGLVEPVQYIGACYARLGRYEEAAEHHHRVMKVAAERGDRRLLVEAQANLGVMHYLKGEYETAHSYYSQAAEIAEQIGLITERAQVYNNVGFVLFRLGRPREAEQGFLRAIEVFRDYGALASLIGPYNGMGNVLVEQHRYDEAADYYQRALALAREVGDIANVGVSHMHLGRCASLHGRFTDAKTEFALALNALEATSFWNPLTRTYQFIAEMNLRLGNIAEAIRCADQNVALARRHANVRMEASAWRQKAEALKRADRAAEAKECLARAEELGARSGAAAT